MSLITSGYVLMEIERVLKQMGFDEIKIIESLIYLRSFIGLVDVSEKDIKKYWDTLKDKSDVPVLAAAIRSKSVLITGDKELKKVGSKLIAVKSTVEVLKKVR
jgi:predicted nucleic acid-binding protein